MLTTQALAALLALGLVAAVAAAAVATPLSMSLSHQVAPQATQPQALDEEHEHEHHDDEHQGVQGVRGEDEEHEEDFGLGHVELKGFINSSSITGIAKGDRVQLEANLQEGKRASLEVDGLGKAKLNVTAVAIDATTGTISIQARVLNSTVAGLAPGDTVSLIVSLTKLVISDGANSSVVLLTQLEARLP